MNSRLVTGIIIAVFGILLVVAGIFLAARLFDVNFSAPEPQPTPVIETKVMVAFATSDIAKGAVLNEGDVELKEIPIQYIPRDTVEVIDEAIGTGCIPRGVMIIDQDRQASCSGLWRGFLNFTSKFVGLDPQPFCDGVTKRRSESHRRNLILQPDAILRLKL